MSTYSLHPGVVDSDIWRALPRPLRALNRLRRLISTEEGARTTLHCAASEAAGAETGMYYSESRPTPASAAAQNRALAEELWRRSEEAVSRACRRPHENRSNPL